MATSGQEYRFKKLIAENKGIGWARMLELMQEEFHDAEPSRFLAFRFLPRRTFRHHVTLDFCVPAVGEKYQPREKLKDEPQLAIDHVVLRPNDPVEDGETLCCVPTKRPGEDSDVVIVPDDPKMTENVLTADRIASEPEIILPGHKDAGKARHTQEFIGNYRLGKQAWDNLMNAFCEGKDGKKGSWQGAFRNFFVVLATYPERNFAHHDPFLSWGVGTKVWVEETPPPKSVQDCCIGQIKAGVIKAVNNGSYSVAIFRPSGEYEYMCAKVLQRHLTLRFASDDECMRFATLEERTKVTCLNALWNKGLMNDEHYQQRLVYELEEIDKQHEWAFVWKQVAKKILCPDKDANLLVYWLFGLIPYIDLADSPKYYNLDVWERYDGCETSITGHHHVRNEARCDPHITLEKLTDDPALAD